MEQGLGRDYLQFKFCNVGADEYIKVDYKYLIQMKEDGNNPLKFILEIPLYNHTYTNVFIFLWIISYDSLLMTH